MALEREAKLSAGPDLVIPDLSAGLEGAVVEAAPAQRLDAVYHDTEDLRLARSGVTVRRRTGEGSTRWTVKFPRQELFEVSSGLLAREEIDVVDRAVEMPQRVRDLVVAFARTAPLVPVARLRTWRRRLHIVDAAGGLLAELADDAVEVLEGDTVRDRFREIEVEVTPRAPDGLLEGVVEVLHEAGAGSADPVPKVVRALGPAALEPADVVVPPLDATARMGDVARAAVARGVLEVIALDRHVRSDGSGVAVAAFARAAVDLWAAWYFLADVLAPDAPRPGDADLAALYDLAQRVVELDVVRSVVAAAVEALEQDADRDAARAVMAHLDAQRTRAHARLVHRLRSARHLRFLERCVDGLGGEVTRRGRRPVGELGLPRLMRPWWRDARRHVRRASFDLEALSALRSDLAVVHAGVVAAGALPGLPVDRPLRRITKVEDDATELWGALSGEAALRSAAGALPRRAAFVAGLLVAHVQRLAEVARYDFERAWARADRRKITEWLE